MNNTLLLFERFFKVYLKPQTYLNLVYLMLAFPLGLFYFLFLVIGLSTGISLIIVWIGLIILAVLVAGIWIFAAFERLMSNALLQTNISPTRMLFNQQATLWQKMKGYLTNPMTWKGMLFLFLKFPLGLLSFVLTTTLLALSLGCMAAPILFPFIPFTFFSQIVDTLPEALGVFLFGIFILTGSLHGFNFYADLLKQISQALLGNTTNKQETAVESTQNEETKLEEGIAP